MTPTFLERLAYNFGWFAGVFSTLGVAGLVYWLDGSVGVALTAIGVSNAVMAAHYVYKARKEYLSAVN